MFTHKITTQRIYLSIALLFIIFHGISLGFIQRLGLVPPLPIDGPSKILWGMFLLALLTSPARSLATTVRSRYILTLVIWVIFVTIISFMISLTLSIDVPFSNTQRTIEQLGGFVAALIAGHYIGRMILTDSTVLYKGLLIALTLAAMGIVIQIYLAGIGSIINYRLFGINGEPKGLGLFLVPFFIANLSCYRSSFWQIILLMTIISAIVLTKSATSLIALTIMTTVYLVFNFEVRKKITWKKFAIIGVILFFVAFILLSASDIRHMLIDRIALYSKGSFTEGTNVAMELPAVGWVVVEANDAPVIKMLLDYPLFIITGVGYGQESVYSFRYLVESGGIGFLRFDYTGYITPNMALVQNIANFGLIGLIILGILGFKALREIKYDNNRKNEYIKWFFLSHFLISLFIFRTSIPIMMSAIVLAMMLKETKDWSRMTAGFVRTPIFENVTPKRE